VDPVDKIVASIRKACRPGTWSLGVKLAREQGVVVESREDEEIVLRVKAPGRPVPPTVVLYPGEREWDCDCGSRVSPCEHVAAAAIALTQTAEDAAAPPATPAAGAAAPGADEPGPATPPPSRPAPRPLSAPAWGRIVYRLARDGAGLRLTRGIAFPDGREVPLASTLGALLSRPGEAETVGPEEADLLADRIIGPPTRAALPPSKLDALLRVLASSPRVLLDGRPVAVAEDEVLPVAVVEDRGADVVVTIARPPEAVEVVSAGVVLCAEEGALALHRLGETELAGPHLQHLPRVRAYPPPALGELAAAVLPDLARRFRLEVRSRRVPRLVRDVPPRVVLDLAHVGDSLTVLPTLVYGAPAHARIDDGKMVHLGGPVPIRDTAAERTLVHRLRDELDLIPGRRMTFSGIDAGKLARKLERWRGALTGDAAGVVGASRALEARLRVTSAAAPGGGPPLVDVEITFTAPGKDGAAGQAVDAAAVLRAWSEGLPLVPLDGGGWASLPQAWLDAHGARVADLLAARDAAGHLATHALPELGALCDELHQPRPVGLDQLAPLFQTFERLPEPVLPADLTATLRPYQRQGAAWLAFLRGARLGGILADDMGLGKTLQALCATGPGTLVVCPTSVLHNWAAELARFRPGLRVCEYHGPARRLDPDADVTLTTYALLRLDGARLAARSPAWRAVYLDEAQAIKNPGSQVARAAFALPADFRLALTGTPIENRLDELWSLMQFANPGLLGGRAEFDERYARELSAPPGTGGAAASEARARLRERIRPFVLRRLKRDVAPELPPRVESVLRVELDERERAVYDAVHAATRADVVAMLGRGEGQSGGVMKVLEMLLRLRQAASHAALVPGQTAASSSKVEALLEALGTAAADGHKALVFSQWTSFLDLIEPHLEAAGIAFTRLDGTTRDRGAVVETFQADGGPPVMLISLKAGGSGLNLTAADHVFLCDLWWNPAVEAQAADRAHRIGQERPVMVYRLVALGTVEERILALQEQKRGLFDAALGDAGRAAALTREDLLALLA
jgi:SNF2-related domain/Helicase conserved C-terminal domain